MRRQTGFTLWELLLTVAIAGVISGLGLPALRWLLLDLRLTADVNAFVSAVQRARSEAATRNSVVVMCNSPNGLDCGAGQDGFSAGWIVFVNDDRERPPARDAGEQLLLVHRPASRATIASNRSWYEFRPFALRSTNGTTTFCDERGDVAARAVIVSYTGRPRTIPAASAAGVPCTGH